MIHRSVLFAVLLALAGCGDAPPEQGPPPPPDAPSVSHAWRSTPSGAQLSVRGDTLRASTTRHTVLWDERVPELAPPYAVEAVLHKRSGRLHEGVALVFGGSGLAGPESGQVYSYFMVRGDGSYLIKRRQGTATPVVRDWTRHPAIRRDEGGSGRANRLQVAVTDTVVRFSVNGAEVARVPAAELSIRGRAGIRASHDVELDVVGFAAGERP